MFSVGLKDAWNTATQTDEKGELSLLKFLHQRTCSEEIFH